MISGGCHIGKMRSELKFELSGSFDLRAISLGGPLLPEDGFDWHSYSNGDLR